MEFVAFANDPLNRRNHHITSNLGQIILMEKWTVMMDFIVVLKGEPRNDISGGCNEILILCHFYKR